MTIILKSIAETIEMLSGINKKLTDYRESFNWRRFDEEEFLRLALVDDDKLRKVISF